MNANTAFLCLLGIIIPLYCIVGTVFYTNFQQRASDSEQLQILRSLKNTVNNLPPPPVPNGQVPEVTCNCVCPAPSLPSTLALDSVAVTLPDSVKAEHDKLLKFLATRHHQIPEPLLAADKLPTYDLINKYDPLSEKVDLSKYKRKVFLDLGGRHGDSAEWFLKEYPHSDQFEIWVFEADKEFNKFHTDKPWKYFNLAVWIRNETVQLGSAGRGSSIVVEHQVNKTEVAGFDFSEFLGNFAYDDFIVCKMDIEGAEFQIVPKLLSDLSIFKIDEFMLECHYYEWTVLFPNIKRKDCLRMINELRDLSLYVHEWN